MSRIATIGGKQVILAEPYQPRACPAVGRGHEMCIVSEKEKPGE